jgi:GNAT superfamily N-acetyltransferase
MIRPATEPDVETIVAIHVAGFRAVNSPHLSPEAADRMTPERSAASWRGLIESPPTRGTVLVAENDHKVIGATAAGPSRDPGAEADDAEMYALYVDPRYWGEGCGATLDAAARGHLADRGFGDAILWVLEENDRARRFYEREGWSADGGRRDHFGATALRYRVTL